MSLHHNPSFCMESKNTQCVKNNYENITIYHNHITKILRNKNSKNDVSLTKKLWSSQKAQRMMVQQGGTGDCFLISTIWALLTKYPNKIDNIMFVDQCNNIIVPVKKKISEEKKKRLLKIHGTYQENNTNNIVIPFDEVKTFTGISTTNIRPIQILEHLISYFYDNDIGNSVMMHGDRKYKENSSMYFLKATLNFEAQQIEVANLKDFKDKPVYLGMICYHISVNGVEEPIEGHAYAVKDLQDFTTKDGYKDTLVDLMNPNDSTQPENWNLSDILQEKYNARPYVLNFKAYPDLNLQEYEIL